MVGRTRPRRKKYSRLPEKFAKKAFACVSRKLCLAITSACDSCEAGDYEKRKQLLSHDSLLGNWNCYFTYGELDTFIYLCFYTL